MTTKQLGIAVAIFIAGMVLSPKGTNPTQIKSAETDTVKSQMTQLRDTDNKVFMLAGSAMTACSDMIKGIQEGDAAKVTSQSDLMDSISDNIEILKTERDVILTEAGIPNQ